MQSRILDVTNIRTNHRTYENYYTAKDIAVLRECSIGKAYKVINYLNAELEEKGMLIDAGRVNKKYYHDRCDLPDEAV